MFSLGMLMSLVYALHLINQISAKLDDRFATYERLFALKSRCEMRRDEQADLRALVDSTSEILSKLINGLLTPTPTSVALEYYSISSPLPTAAMSVYPAAGDFYEDLKSDGDPTTNAGTSRRGSCSDAIAEEIPAPRPDLVEIGNDVCDLV